MKNRVCFSIITLSFFAFSNLWGQKPISQVISYAGAGATEGRVQLSWTVGEPVISSLITSTNILKQGFYQSKLEITAIDLPEFPELELYGYPNPVSTAINLDIKGERRINLSFCLLAIEGKILFIKKIVSLSEQLIMEPFENGVNLIKVYQDIDMPLRTFRRQASSMVLENWIR